MKKQYDLVVSLGGNCAAASQLRMRGLRSFSLPFDWVFMESDKCVEYLPRGFANGFRDFCLKENLKPINAKFEGGMAKYHYKDSLSGFCFIHHFHKSIDEIGGYELSISVIRKRIERLFSKIQVSHRILLILATGFPFDPVVARI